MKLRSCSVNSNSSTSRLQSKSKKKLIKKKGDTECDQLEKQQQYFNQQVYEQDKANLSIYKKFSKQIGSVNFIKTSSMLDEENGNNKKSIDWYEKFIKSICRYSSKTIKQQKQPEKLEIAEEKPEKSTKNKLVKSISAPINILINTHRARKQHHVKQHQVINETNNEQIIPTAENTTTENTSKTTTFLNYENEATTFSNLDNIKHSDKLIALSRQDLADPNVSFKKKISNFVIGIGTYVVTCGSSQSRKLPRIRQLKEKIK